MQLKVNEIITPDEIKFNYEELKAELTEKVRTYEMIVYSDDQIKEAKVDKANLNKLKKALNDERIRMEKEYLKPFNQFKAQVNEIISIIDKPIAIIDKQVKEYERQKQEEKAQEIAAFFETLEDIPEWLTLSKIWSDKWLNASYTTKKVHEEIEAAVARINNDLATLASLPGYSFEATEEYKRTLDLNKAISEGARLEELQRRKQEAEKAKQEAVKEYPQEDLSQYMNPSEPEKVPEEKPKQWVAFKALLTMDQARELAAWCKARMITIKALEGKK